jgi:hypothetical protein
MLAFLSLNGSGKITTVNPRLIASGVCSCALARVDRRQAS